MIKGSLPVGTRFEVSQSAIDEAKKMLPAGRESNKVFGMACEIEVNRILSTNELVHPQPFGRYGIDRKVYINPNVFYYEDTKCSQGEKSSITISDSQFIEFSNLVKARNVVILQIFRREQNSNFVKLEKNLNFQFILPEARQSQYGGVFWFLKDLK